MNLLRKIISSKKSNYRLFIIWILLLSTLYSILSVLRHVHFQSGGFDLGIFDQAVWQYSHFLFPYNTIKERFILGDHLTLTLPLLSLLYWIWQDAKSLIIFQAIFITFSAIAIYKIAILRKFSPYVSFCLGVIYSLFWGIQFAVYFDFHPIIIGVGLLAWVVYFFEAKKWKLFWITLGLMLLTQENLGIALACIGLIYFFKKDFRKKSILFVIGGLATSLIFVKITGLLSPVGYQYFPTFDLSPLHLFLKYFDINDKRTVWVYTFSWFSFLPLFSPGAILAVLLDLSQYFLPLKQYGHMVTPYLHERAILAPIVTLGLFDVLIFLKKRKFNITLIVTILLISTLIQQYVFHFPLNKLSKRVYWQNESWMANDNKLFKLIPKDASVATAQNLAPHLSERKEIYLLYPRIKSFKNCNNCWWLEYAGKPQYLVVDLHTGQSITQLLESYQNFSSAIKNMENSGKIIKFKNINYAYIYKINY